MELLRKKNAEAVIVTTDWNELDGSAIVKAMEEKQDFAVQLMAELKEHEHHHDHACCDHDHEHNGHEHHYDENGMCSCGHHHHHHADDVFASFGRETARVFTE
ncbi:CobW/HypB/UreG protein, partial [gut metagenome]